MAKLTFISWNVNGIRAVARKGALKWVDSMDIDFLGLQEVKAQEDEIPNNLFQRHYRFTILNPSFQKGQSGVVLFTDIEGKSSFCCQVDTLCEGRINEYRFNNIAYFNVYVPNGKRGSERLNYKMEFYGRLLDYLLELRKQGFSIIIGGDFNTAYRPIDIARPKENENTSGFLPIERAWIDKFISAGFIDTFRYIHGDEPNRYSWWSYRTKARERNVGWRIDYFFVSEDLKEKIVDADILESITGSDHCPIKLILDI